MNLLEGNAFAAIAGTSLGVFLLGLGVAIGYRLRRRQLSVDGMTEEEREQMLRLLRELSQWTSEYSGNVSQYQDKLSEIADVVRKTSSTSGDNRVIALLQQIMDGNEQLQTRLDAAERQLDKQRLQIEAYLTEARTDGLTGLFNRRALDRRLEELFENYRKGGRSFVLALIDIDHFKSVNDDHGHQAGDLVLQRVAALLRSQLGSALIVARYGGEEFAVIGDGPLRHAAERMNEFRKQLAAERIEFERVQLRVTVSIGLSEPRDDLGVAPVIRRADEALYAAKNIGRDRVYYHDGRGPTLVGAPEVAR